MTAATGVRREALEYLAAVASELADLPAEDRSALLEDLSLHLDALAVEDDDRPLPVRLGQPAAYAADLRAAAGLPSRGERTRAAAAGLRDWAARVGATNTARRVAPAARATRRLLGELRPAWWVLRGYLVVLVPCLLGSDYRQDLPFPAPMRSHFLGVVLVLVAVTASVILGRRRLPRAVGVVVVAAGVLLVLTSAAVGKSVWETVRHDYASAASAAFMSPPEQAVGQFPLLSRYGPVTDVFPYAADGTPLQGVLLYDQDGRPLHVGFQQWWADQCARVLKQPEAADGVAVPNSYPQSYVLDPAGVDLSRSIRRTPDSCEAVVPRPAVPLPTFPAADATAPAPGN